MAFAAASTGERAGRATRPYCGPTAIAAVLGITCEEAEDRIIDWRRGGFEDRGINRVTTTYADEINALLPRIAHWVRRPRSVKNTLQDVKLRRGWLNCRVLIRVGHHFLAFDGDTGELIDNGVREPTPWRKRTDQHQNRVTHYWVVPKN